MSQNGNGNGKGAKSEMIRVGVIGYGYWGPNVVRNFFAVDQTRVEMLCDTNPSALARAKKNYPGLEVTTDPDEILKSPNIDAVAVVTDTDALTPPCGACRQIIWEFCGDAEIILANLKGKTERHRMAALFPKPFDNSNL